jgi:hypothetical protein
MIHHDAFQFCENEEFRKNKDREQSAFRWATNVPVVRAERANVNWKVKIGSGVL